MNSRLEDTLCPYPFLDLWIDPQGRIDVCCLAKRSPIDTFLEATPQSITKSFNSENHRKIRKEMLNGKKPSECAACFDIEKNGGQTFRQIALQEHWLDLMQSIPNVDNNGTLRGTPRTLRIDFGNTCNLRCRMCSPSISKGLANDWKKIGWMNNIELKKMKTTNWYQSDEMIDLLVSTSSSMKKILILGGEPFVNKWHFTFLDRLISAKVSANLELSYVTNLTVLKEDWHELWNKFKSVDFLVSIDGIGDVFEYVRHPGNWEDFEKNLSRLVDWGLSSRFRTSLLFTVQALTWPHIPEFIKWYQNHYAATELGVIANMLDEPFEQSVFVTPPSTFHAAYDEIQNRFQSSPAPQLQGFKSVVNAVANNYETRQPEYIKHYQTFLDFHKRLDSVRGESLSSILPDWESASGDTT